MECTHQTVQGTREKRRGSAQSSTAMPGLPTRGCSSPKKQKATAVKPSLLLMSPTRLLVEVGLVDLGVVLPLIRHSIFWKDRAHRAHRFARSAIDAFIGMDEIHVVCIRCIYAVNRTHIKA